MKISDLKIAFAGASHWHVPIYLPAVESEKLKVVGFSDPRKDVADRFAAKYGCASYASADEMFDKEKPDFVFAFDVHSKMPELALNLIDRGIPFSIEKPLGLNSDDVRRVKAAAEERGVYCSIPFVWRYSEIVKNVRARVAPGEIRNLSYQFIAGPTSRYIEPSPWMLQAKTAGTGCMTNLGVHFIDMALLLTGSDSGTALGSVFHYMSGYDVEGYATTLVKLSSGASLTLQTGYAYPMDESKRDNCWNFTTTSGYYTVKDGYIEYREFGKETNREYLSTDSDIYYAVYAAETLKDYLAGNKPAAGLDDMLRTRLVLDDIIAKAGPAPKARRSI